MDTKPKTAEPSPIPAPEVAALEQPAPVNLQKRNYELDATRFGDWELNGRCIDF